MSQSSLQLGVDKPLSESTYGLPPKPSFVTPGAVFSDSKPVQASLAPTNPEASSTLAQILNQKHQKEIEVLKNQSLKSAKEAEQAN